MKNVNYLSLKTIYTKANEYRKNSAHLVENKNKNLNANNAIKELEEFHSQFNNILKNHAH